MTRDTAERIADQHGIRTRRRGEWVELLEVWTVGGQGAQRWVSCPATRAELLAWLGY